MLLLPLFLTALSAPGVQPVEAGPFLEPTLFPAVPFQDADEPKWTGAVNAGATWTTGNTETTEVSTSANAERRSDDDRWTTSAWFNYGEQATVTPGVPPDSQVTKRDYGGKAQYDRFLSETSYWYANGSAESNDRAGLQLRAVAGAGMGRQLREDEKLKLNGEAGLSFVDEDLEGASPNEYVAARAAYNGSYVVSETTKLEQNAEILASLKDTDDWNSRLDTRLKVSMTENMFLQLQHVLAYDNTPAAGAAPADHKLILTVGWSF